MHCCGLRMRELFGSLAVPPGAATGALPRGSQQAQRRSRAAAVSACSAGSLRCAPAGGQHDKRWTPRLGAAAQLLRCLMKAGHIPTGGQSKAVGARGCSCVAHAALLHLPTAGGVSSEAHPRDAGLVAHRRRRLRHRGRQHGGDRAGLAQLQLPRAAQPPRRRAQAGALLRAEPQGRLRAPDQQACDIN